MNNPAINSQPVDHSRRALLKGSVSPQIPVRPPWSGDEQRFLSLCTGCGECLTACPENILLKGDGGFPEVNFAAGECTFCGECVDVCDTSALSTQDYTRPWAFTAQISDSCLTLQGVVCQSCGDECEARAITFTRNETGTCIPVIHSEKCTGCGACYRVCPVLAISFPASNISELSHDQRQADCQYSQRLQL